MTSTSVPSTISPRGIAWLLLVAGAIGWVAAMVLAVEKINLITDDAYVPTCSINPILNCGSIMRTGQAEAFGFPNPLIGITAFPVVAATGTALLAGATMRRWFWLCLQAGVTLGAGFVAWLIFQSLYRIGALCPYCMVVWAAVIPLFWYVTLRNLTEGAFGQRLARSSRVRSVAEWHAAGLIGLFALPLGLIIEQFWFYWRTVL